jgi:hypothetical protein
MRNPTYSSWSAMRARCLRPDHKSWPRYGGRGIEICAEWLVSFENFVRDMGERPAGLTLDRLDKDGPYAPGNCRWATRAEQSRNRYINREGNAKGGYRAAEVRWAGHVPAWKAAGLKKTTFYKRLRSAAWAERKAAFDIEGQAA